MSEDRLERAAADANHVCTVCGGYVKSKREAEVDADERFGHRRCLDALNRSPFSDSAQDGDRDV
jgi:hypothetical protein